jgi:pimeloyl-ACP methyl ester carboxylesterase
MQTRAVSTDYGDVTIREWGEDTTQGDRLLLALHSMGPVSTGALYNCAVGPLVEAGYHVVAPDLPGYGLTAALPPDEYDVARLADRMWALSDALGGTRITLVGHSWGGAIAMRMQMESGPQLNALVLVDSGHVDYADVNGVDASLSLEEWVQRARDRRLVVADRAALAVALEVDAEDRLMDDLLLGVVEQDGRLVSRVTPEAQGAALYHLGRARQTETWPALQEEQIPTLLLLATEPEEARELNERAGHTFKAVIHQAEVQLLEGTTHSLVTDIRIAFGQLLAEWLAPLS